MKTRRATSEVELPSGFRFGAFLLFSVLAYREPAQLNGLRPCLCRRPRDRPHRICLLA